MSTLESWLTHYTKDPEILVAFGIIIFTSIVFPLAVAYAFRLWSRINRAWNAGAAEEQQANQLGLGGSFNSNVLKDLYHATKEEEKEDDEELNSESESEPEAIKQDKRMDKKPEQTLQVGPYLQSAKPKPSKIQLLKQAGGQNTPPDSQPQTPDISTQLLMGKKTKSQQEEETVKALKNLSENGLHGKLATAQLRARTHKIEERMTDAEREKERQIKNEQLNSIFMMMQAQGEKFGVRNKNDLEEQLKLYSV